jgi:hypothetical protein
LVEIGQQVSADIDIPSRLKLIEEFNNCKIKSWKQDPSTWITELDDFRTRINETGGSKSEINMLEHIRINMPKEYKDLYTIYHSQVGASKDPLTNLETLTNEMTLLFKHIGMLVQYSANVRVHRNPQGGRDGRMTDVA